MRTKNPFCSGAELAVLKVITAQPVKSLRVARVNRMAEKIRMSSATFGHAITSLKRAGHIGKDAYGVWRLGPTGKVLVACANDLALARRTPR